MSNRAVHGPALSQSGPDTSVVAQFEFWPHRFTLTPDPVSVHHRCMLDRSKVRPRDSNQLAYRIMLESTGQAPKFTPEAPAKNPAAVALGRLGGLKGGAARAAALSGRKRSA